MFFGDEGISYTFSFKFSLKDFHSRGFKRNYSINIISKDKVHLLNSWDFYCKNLEGIVSKLKSEAEACFVKEHAHHGTSLLARFIITLTFINALSRYSRFAREIHSTGNVIISDYIPLEKWQTPENPKQSNQVAL